MAKKKIVKEKTEFPKTKEEKLARFKTLARAQNKKAGETVVTFGSDMVKTTKTSIGVPEMDLLLGGGIPDGRIITIWGDKGCGKTSAALQYVVESQKAGKVCYYIALEKLDRERMEDFGVNLDELMIGQFPKAEMCLDSILDHAAAQSVDVIVLDSIHSLSPKGEQEDKNGKQKSLTNENMALLAKKLSEFFRRANHNLAKGKITLLLIGQTRIDLGGFIKLEKLTCGNALKHYSKLILHMRHGQGKNAPTEHQEDENGDGHTVKIGFECVCKIDKTQVSGTENEGTETRFPFFFDGAFTKRDEIKIIESEGLEKDLGIKKLGFVGKSEILINADGTEAEITVNSKEEAVKLIGEPIAKDLPIKKKRGRGRPKKNKENKS